MKHIEKIMIALGLLAVVLIGIGAFNALRFNDQMRYISDRCWVMGGTMDGYTCKMPEDKRTPQEKVCVAMKGSFVVAEDKMTREKEFWCYSDEGKELKLPNLEGKEVVTMTDGTVLLRKK